MNVLTAITPMTARSRQIELGLAGYLIASVLAAHQAEHPKQAPGENPTSPNSPGATNEGRSL